MRHPILRLLASWALGASLAGCTTTYQPGRPPVTTLDDPLGNHVVFAPPPPAIEPPLRVPASDTLPPPAMPRAGGTYSGWATIVGAPQGACASEMRVANFRVVATRVRYGRFAGRITPDGGLEMFSGTASITGRFRGAHFQGQMSIPGRESTDGCDYVMTLDRA